MLDLTEVQEQIEKDMVRRGRSRYDEIRRRAETTDDALRSKSYRVVLDAALDPLAEGIERFLRTSAEKRVGRRVRSALFMADLDPAALAYIALATTITSSPKGPVPLVRLAERIGRAVEVETHFHRLEKEAPGLAHAQKKILKSSSTTHHRKIVAKLFTGSAERSGTRERWGASDRVSVGVKLVELLIETTGLFRIHRTRVKNKTTDTVCPAEGFRLWVDEMSDSLAEMFPTWAPTVVPPRDWTALNSGGYLTDAIPFPPTFVKTSSKDHIAALEGADLSRVMAAVNAIQRTPWRVNSRVLEVAEVLIRQGRPVAGLPDMEPEPIPTAPVDFDADPEATKRWKRAAAAAYTRNAKVSHWRLRALNAVSMAGMFSSYERIYFPHQCDFRGRIYPIPTHLSPQGNDLQKGLITFADGAPLGSLEGARWFEIHGANCYGIDKVPFSERQAWVAENAERICSSAASPLDYTWWMEADSPFQFLAWCFEYAEWRASGFDLGFVSRVPVAMDGSCNGIQHYSAMLRDPRGGRATNLIPSDRPQDLYAEVAEVVREKLRKIYSEKLVGTQEERFARIWLDYGVDRALCKPAVIGFSFGGTQDGAYMGVLGVAEEQPPARLAIDAGELPTACRFLAKVVWEAIGEVASGAKAAMIWLRDVARQSSGSGEGLRWETPSGFVVLQNRRRLNKKQIELVMFGRRVQSVLRQETAALDKRKQADSFPPNYVHSMDGACLALSVLSATRAGITQFAMIHDSYGCPAGDAPELSRILREVFVSVYSDDPLGQLHQGLQKHLTVGLRKPPFIGGLNLSDVMRSDYFFA